MRLVCIRISCLCTEKKKKRGRFKKIKVSLFARIEKTFQEHVGPSRNRCPWKRPFFFEICKSGIRRTCALFPCNKSSESVDGGMVRMGYSTRRYGKKIKHIPAQYSTACQKLTFHPRFALIQLGETYHPILPIAVRQAHRTPCRPCARGLSVRVRRRVHLLQAGEPARGCGLLLYLFLFVYLFIYLFINCCIND